LGKHSQLRLGNKTLFNFFQKKFCVVGGVKELTLHRQNDIQHNNSQHKKVSMTIKIETLYAEGRG
jgi:hypothetical protein